MKRFSVLYLLKERYHQISCATQADTKTVLNNLLTDKRRTPVGVYDAKTELFEWESTYRPNDNQASIEEQGKLGDQIITIAQSLRRRDSSWQKIADYQRPTFFA